MPSLPVRGAWIEIETDFAPPQSSRRRSPCGERGLKWTNAIKRLNYTKSLPVRGAWIEIAGAKGTHRYREGRSPCGERGLKYFADGQLVDALVAPRAGSVD